MRSLLMGVIGALTLGACISQTSTPGPISVEGSAAAGFAYAQANCAQCHALAAGETDSPYFGAPTFNEIANTPGMTGLALQVWLRSPHENMPQIMVDSASVDDVWAYIASLERR